jgi:NAD(P)-dependent dehydrogenase (short-subunit alcohol dehydrogenase family)
MNKKLKKNRPLAIVSGGTSGIGLAISQELIRKGYFVLAGSLEPTKNSRVAASKDFLWVKTDIRNEEEVSKLFLAASKITHQLKVLVNCAGVGVFKNLTDITSQDWRTVLDTNLTGSFFCSRLAFEMMRSYGGRIIHIGSICGHIGLPQNAAYAASKFGLRGLSQVINEEGKDFGIKSTIISLGAVYTDIWLNRKDFNSSDMLSVSDVSQTVVEIISKRENVRIDEIKILPPKGIL